MGFSPVQIDSRNSAALHNIGPISPKANQEYLIQHDYKINEADRYDSGFHPSETTVEAQKDETDRDHRKFPDPELLAIDGNHRVYNRIEFPASHVQNHHCQNRIEKIEDEN